MDGRYVYVEQKIIWQYINKYGDKLLGRDNELLAASILKSFFEKRHRTKCMIGFKLDEKYCNIYSKKTKPLTLEEMKELFEHHSDENGPVDFSISPIASVRNRKHSAWVFQLKRFGHFQKEKGPEGLIKLIEGVRDKYAKCGVSLVILLDGHKGTIGADTLKNVDMTNFPFQEIMFIRGDKNDDGIFMMQVGHLWPVFGYNEYDARELIDKS